MNAPVELPKQAGVATVTGSPSEVSQALAGIDAERVVAFALPHGAGAEADVIFDTFTNLAPFVQKMMRKRHKQTLETIVEALVPTMVPEPHQLKEAAMLAHVRTAILNSGDWITAPQIARVAGFSATNPSAQPGKWKRDGAIFAIRHKGIDYYPTFGLDAEAGYRPLKSMAAVIQALAATKDGWGMAYWFQSLNSFLGGKRPQDLVASAPQRVLAAAEDEVQEISHG